MSRQASRFEDEKGYAQLHALIDAAFDSRDVEVLLNRVLRYKLRIRDFEGVLERGLLGKEAIALYKALPVSDQGLTRERYLRLVEAGAAGIAAEVFQGIRVLLRRIELGFGFRLSLEQFKESTEGTDRVWRRKSLIVQSRT